MKILVLNSDVATVRVILVAAHKAGHEAFGIETKRWNVYDVDGIRKDLLCVNLVNEVDVLFVDHKTGEKCFEDLRKKLDVVCPSARIIGTSDKNLQTYLTEHVKITDLYNRDTLEAFLAA